MPKIESIDELQRRRDELRGELAVIGDFRPGTLVEYKRKCGKPNCHCAQRGDPGHPGWAHVAVARRGQDGGSGGGAGELRGDRRPALRPGGGAGRREAGGARGGGRLGQDPGGEAGRGPGWRGRSAGAEPARAGARLGQLLGGRRKRPGSGTSPTCRFPTRSRSSTSSNMPSSLLCRVLSPTL